MGQDGKAQKLSIAWRSQKGREASLVRVARSPSSLAATERGLSDLDQMPSPNIASNCAAWSQLRSRLGDHGLDEAVVVDLAVVVGDGLLDHLVHLAGSGAGDWARGSRAGVRPSTRRADEGRSEGAREGLG